MPTSPQTLRAPNAGFDVRRLINWLPVDALLVDGEPRIKWMEMRDVPLAEPFFFQTVERAKRVQPNASEAVTGLEALIQLEKISESVRPAGFVFHASRCGSTLLANACRAIEGNVVISEAPVVEKLVSRFFSYSKNNPDKMLFNSVVLRAAVKALGQRRLGTEENMIVKFSSLSLLYFQQIKRTSPQARCIFMFRDPLEVIMSNVHNPPEWMQFDSNPEQARAVTGLPADDALKVDAEERCARALGKFYAAGAELVADGAMPIDYRELSSEKLIEVVRFLGASPTESEKESIRRVAQLYSKDPSFSQEFAPDSARKQSAVSWRAREAAERWAMEPYLRLTELAKQAVGAINT